MATLLKAFQDARPLLNNSNTSPELWSNQRLLSFVPKAHRELQILLWENGLPVIKEVSAVIDVAALSTTLTLPSDLIVPVRLSERADGSTEEFARMEELSFESATITQTEILRYWCWREEEVKFVGSTANREVKMDYLKGLTIPTLVTSSIGFIFGEMYLGPRIAALAAHSVGNSSSAAEFTADAERWVEKIVNANVKNQQGLPIQRVPYRRSRRSTSSII